MNIFEFKKDVNKKTKEVLIVTTLNTLIEHEKSMKEDIAKLQKEFYKMAAEMEKRDKLFMDFLKVELTTIKTVEKDPFGKDFIKSTYKFIRK